MIANRSNKDYGTTMMLSGVFGMMGIHQFYMERWLAGFLNLLLFSLAIFFFANGRSDLAILMLATDILNVIFVTYLIFVGKYRDGDHKQIMFPGQSPD